MIRLKYIIRSETLVLRISEGKDHYYKRVSHLLLGDPNLKYWDATRNDSHIETPLTLKITIYLNSLRIYIGTLR